MRTFLECRNEIANKEGHADWLTCVFRENLTSILLLDEQAAKLFAEECLEEAMNENKLRMKALKGDDPFTGIGGLSIANEHIQKLIDNLK